MTLSLAEKQVVTSRCIQPDDSLHLTGVAFREIRGRMQPLTAAELEETGDAPRERAAIRAPARAARSPDSRAVATEASAQDGYGPKRSNDGYGYGSDSSNYGEVRIEVKPNQFRHQARVYVDGRP